MNKPAFIHSSTHWPAALGGGSGGWGAGRQLGAEGRGGREGREGEGECRKKFNFPTVC